MYDQDFESCSAPAAASHLVGSKTGFNNKRISIIRQKSVNFPGISHHFFFFLRKNASDARKKRSNKQNRF